MTNPQEQKSQNRMDSIIKLMMEEAKNAKHPLQDIEEVSLSAKIHHVWLRVGFKVREIMRTMRE